MKIIICTRDSKFGGAGTHVRLLIEELGKYDIFEKILVIAPENPLIASNPRIEFLTLPLFGQSFISQQPYFAIRCSTLLSKILKKGNFDLVHTHHPLLGQHSRVPLVSTMHMLNFLMVKSTMSHSKANTKLKIGDCFHRVYELFDEKTISQSERVIFVSHRTMKEALRRYHHFSPRFIHIPNFINTSRILPLDDKAKLALRNRYKLMTDARYFLFVGRLDPLKGIPNLIKAFEYLKQHTNIETKLIIAGDGTLRSYISNLEFVIYLGKIPQDHIADVYNLADYFVLPSLHENFPMSLLEAMSAGLPVIATDVGDAKEIIEDDRMIIRSAGYEDILEKIELLLSLSDEETKKIGERNRKKVVENYSCEKVIPKIIEVYKSVLRSVNPSF